MKKTLSIFILLICLPLMACGKQAINGDDDIPIKVYRETIDVPEITSEHRIFFLADSHITLCDQRDNELLEKEATRSMLFSEGGIYAHDRFGSLIDKAIDSKSEMVVLGGDIIDSAMYASIEFVEQKLDCLDSPYLLLMGNHDFEYGEEYFSEKAYNEYLPRLDKLRSDKPYQVTEYDDLIYFAADDNNNQIDQLIVDAFKSEVAKGKPIVLAIHVPIEPVTGDMSLIETCKEVWGETDDGRSRVTMGINGCIPSPSTQEFIDLVLADDSPVVLVLAGHIHFYHKDMLNDKVVQIVTGAAFEGAAVDITLK